MIRGYQLIGLEVPMDQDSLKLLIRDTVKGVVLTETNFTP